MSESIGGGNLWTGETILQQTLYDLDPSSTAANRQKATLRSLLTTRTRIVTYISGVLLFHLFKGD
jgi:hypothetical protein